MKKLLWMALLAIEMVNPVYSTFLTSEDYNEFRRISERVKSPLYPNQQKLHYEAFDEEINQPNATESQFTLKSGVHFTIDAENLRLFRSSKGYIPYTDDVQKRYGDLKITSDAQNIIIDAEPSLTVQISQLYGIDCTEKFKPHLNGIRLGLMSNRDCFIDNGKYQVTNIRISDQPFPNHKLFHFAEQAQLIRYLNPENKGVDYGFFVRNENAHDIDFYSEVLLATFQVKQVVKEF